MTPLEQQRQTQLPIEEMRKNCSLMIAVPMYGGQCAGTFCRSVANLSAWLTHHKIPYELRFMFNESLITRARNYLSHNFYKDRWEYRGVDENGEQVVEQRPFSHMIFIDSDITFDPLHVAQMMWMMSDDSPYDILCGLYPKKNISWEKVKEAVDKGFADENPALLADFVGDFVVNMPPNSPGFRLDQPTEIMEAGTGFMMIRQKTFEKFREAYPDNWYIPDHVRSEDFDGEEKIMMYFQAEIERTHNRYLSEDYYFCQKVREAGMKVWMLPWINLNHYGSIDFTGKMAAMAAAGISFTADAALLAKYKKKNADKR